MSDELSDYTDPEGIDGRKLSLADLPAPEDKDAVNAFALSFSGYGYYGSFEACADAARTKRRETLLDLRNELFFMQRAMNHHGDGPPVDLYRELLPHFRRLLGG